MRSLKQRLEPVLRRTGVRFAYLWGSRARGRARPDSDYDIAVSLPHASLDRFLDTSVELSKALRTDDVDVIWLEEATPTVRFLVAQRGRLLFEADPEPRIRFACAARRRFRDEARRLRRYDDAMWRRIQDGTYGTLSTTSKSTPR